MKKLYIIIAIFLSGSIYAQQETDQIQTDNSNNDGKTEHSLLASDFEKIAVKELDGTYKILADNGNLMEVRSFEKGELDGTWLQYDENQNLIAIANYKENQKHGKWVIWDSEGIKRYELYYNNGVRTGTWSSWDENGKLLSTKDY